jgi:ferredoxin-NADP reductase
MIYGNRNAGQILFRDETARLLQAYPDRFRLRHSLSKPGPETPLDSRTKSVLGERTTAGRVDHTVLKQEFEGPWADGSLVQHFLIIGTSA